MMWQDRKVAWHFVWGFHTKRYGTTAFVVGSLVPRLREPFGQYFFLKTTFCLFPGLIGPTVEPPDSLVVVMSARFWGVKWQSARVFCPPTLDTDFQVLGYDTMYNPSRHPWKLFGTSSRISLARSMAYCCLGTRHWKAIFWWKQKHHRL